MDDDYDDYDDDDDVEIIKVIVNKKENENDFVNDVITDYHSDDYYYNDY